jgi:hypothetical protein
MFWTPDHGTAPQSLSSGAGWSRVSLLVVEGEEVFEGGDGGEEGGDFVVG